MKNKIMLSLSILLLSVNIYSQIAVQSFENSGDTWQPLTFSTPPCTVGNDVWNAVSSLPGISPNDGSQFWGIRDLNGSCGGNGFETITFPNVSVITASDVNFYFDYYAIGFDNNEDLKYELFFDNISQGEVIVVNGVSGNSDNTNGWRTETVSIPNSVNNVSVILSAKCNNGNERAGFDNIRLAESIANDNCVSAINLTVGSDITQNVVTGTNVGATSSGQLPNPSCANYLGNDVWYTTIVPANGILTIETLDAGSSIDTSIEVYTGNCGSLTQIACHDDKNWPTDPYSKIDLTGLANTTIYIRVWAFNNSSSGDFNIVAYSTPSPANNDCPNAENLVVGNNNTQNVVTGTNVDATNSGQLPQPNCANYQGNDVWFTALIPASGIITVETQNAGSNIDTGLAIYTGSCGSLTQVSCDDDSGIGLYSTINLSGLPNTTIYIRVWTYGNTSSGDFNIVAYSAECPSTTTWNGSSWSNGIPNANTSVIINGNYDTNTHGNFESCNLTVNSGRTVNIRPNNHVIVNNDLTITGTMQVRNLGSLLMKDDNAQVSVNGTFRVHKTTTTLNDNNDYTYWSSPVENLNISTVFASPIYHQGRLYYWDQSIANADGLGGSEALGEWIPAAGIPMEAGRGYISQGPTTGTYPQNAQVNFTGKPNNGEINLSGNAAVYNPGNPNNDLNLVGNPYPSAIDADEFINQNNTSISGTVWFWTHNTVNNQNTSGEQYSANDYASYNLTGGVGTGTNAASGGVTPNKYIASGQGFMVQTLPTVSTIKFNNSMRIEDNNNQFFRGTDTKNSSNSEKDRIWLNVESNNGGASSQTLVGFFENATDGIDNGYDGRKITDGWVNLYSKIDSLKYAIQGLSTFSSDKKVALGFQTYISDNSMLYSISVEKIEGQLKNSDVFLVDNLLNIIHDLKQGNYNFTVTEAGNYPNRFTLQFRQTTLNTEDIKTSNNFLVINRENSINIKANNNINVVKIYDITGRLLIDKNANKNEVNINTQSLIKGSVLIVNTFFEDNSSLSKKIILTK